MAFRGMSLRTLVVAFFLVVSVQINLATAWSWAMAPPLPRLERKGLVLAENVLDGLFRERKQSYALGGLTCCRDVSKSPASAHS